MDKIKVLQINKLYSPHIGGVECIARDIAENLKDRVDMKVLVCQRKGKGTREVLNGIEVTRSGSLGIYSSMPISPGFPLLLKQLAGDRDLLHFHMPFPLGDLSYLLTGPMGLGKKKIMVSWHSDIVRQKQWLKHYRPFLLKFLKRVDRIIVASHGILETSPFLKEFKEKCVVIPYGIDDSPFHRIPSPERIEKIRLEHSGPIILFVGRLVYYKGLEYLIQAMKEVQAKLLIIGTGPLLEQHKKLSEQLGLQDRVVFLGTMKDEEMPLYYRACDIFVLPSTANSEAFGLVQLEAMACGKPIINTSLPTGVPQVSLHGVTGLTVPPGDSRALAEAIHRLLSETNLRQEYGKNALERFHSHFSQEIMVAEIYKIYEETVDL